MASRSVLVCELGHGPAGALAQPRRPAFANALVDTQAGGSRPQEIRRGRPLKVDHQRRSAIPFPIGRELVHAPDAA
jgi:hypothetical protein